MNFGILHLNRFTTCWQKISEGQKRDNCKIFLNIRCTHLLINIIFLQYKHNVTRYYRVLDYRVVFSVKLGKGSKSQTWQYHSFLASYTFFFYFKTLHLYCIFYICWHNQCFIKFNSQSSLRLIEFDSQFELYAKSLQRFIEFDSVLPFMIKFVGCFCWGSPSWTKLDPNVSVSFSHIIWNVLIIQFTLVLEY